MSMAQKNPEQRRQAATPDAAKAWRQFSRSVFEAGTLDRKTKQLIAVAVAHVTQCPHCIEGHAEGAAREGATEAELMEAIWVAAEMRAGGAVAHSRLAFDAFDRSNGRE
jgi:AhpD family alkylhydroperoxidase